MLMHHFKYSAFSDKFLRTKELQNIEKKTDLYLKVLY